MSENILEKIIIKKKLELEIQKKNNPVEELLKIIKNNNDKKLYIDFKREELIKRISLRTIKMIKEGAIKEVKKFNNLKIKKNHSVNKVIGIDELTQFLKKQINFDKAQELISIKTRQYAKRQATWARSRMANWKKINPTKIGGYIKRLNKSFLKLDQ